MPVGEHAVDQVALEFGQGSDAAFAADGATAGTGGLGFDFDGGFYTHRDGAGTRSRGRLRYSGGGSGVGVGWLWIGLWIWICWFVHNACPVWGNKTCYLSYKVSYQGEVTTQKKERRRFTLVHTPAQHQLIV